MKVAVIGGAGKMGRWLVKHFLTQGHSVVISDLKRDEAEAFAERVGAEVAAGNLEAAEGADVVLVSVPIEITPKVLMDVAPNLKENAELVEIASLKTHIIPVLRKIAESRCVKTVSIHPLFGPGAKKLSEERIALIPVSNLEMEVKEAGRLFPGAEIIPVDAEIHDRIMALTLSVPHFINIAFTSLLGEENLELLKRLGGTTFILQLALSEGVMTEDPHLYASIQMSSDYTIHYLDRLLSKMKSLRDVIARKDEEAFSRLYNEARTRISRDETFRDAYERMYRLLEALKSDRKGSVHI